MRGDLLGKRSRLEGTAALGLLAPLLALAWTAGVGRQEEVGALPYSAAVFALLGAAGNGGTIAMLGYLIEISPDERRPAYSGYFNALSRPRRYCRWRVALSPRRDRSRPCHCVAWVGVAAHRPSR